MAGFSFLLFQILGISLFHVNFYKLVVTNRKYHFYASPESGKVLIVKSTTLK